MLGKLLIHDDKSIPCVVATILIQVDLYSYFALFKQYIFFSIKTRSMLQQYMLCQWY